MLKQYLEISFDQHLNIVRVKLRLCVYLYDYTVYTFCEGAVNRYNRRIIDTVPI